MPFPAAVELVTITWGHGWDILRTEVTASLTIKPILPGTQKLVWAATGDVLFPLPVPYNTEGGQMIYPQLPAVDQDGWLDASGQPYRDWSYQADLVWRSKTGKQQTETKTFKVVQGQGIVDLDLIFTGTVGAPTVAPLAVVSSLAGLTGRVEVDQLIALGFGGATDPQVAGFITAGGSLTRAAIINLSGERQDEIDIVSTVQVDEVSRTNTAPRTTLAGSLNHGLGVTRGTLSFPGEYTRYTVTDADPLAHQQRIQILAAAPPPVPGQQWRYGLHARTDAPSGVTLSAQFQVSSGTAPARVYTETHAAGAAFGFLELSLPAPVNATGVTVWVSLPPHAGKAVGQTIDIQQATTCGLPWFNGDSPPSEDGTTIYGWTETGTSYEYKKAAIEQTVGTISRTADGTGWRIPPALLGGGGGGTAITQAPLKELMPMRPLRKQKAPNQCNGTTLTQLAATRGTLSLAPGLVRMTVTDGDPGANQQRIQFNGISFEVGEIFRFGAEVRTTSTAAAIVSIAFDRGANGMTYRRYGSRVEAGEPFTFVECVAEVPQGTQAVVAWVSLQPGPGKTVGDVIEVRKVTTAGLPYIDASTPDDPDAGLYYETVAGVTTEMTPDPDGDLPAHPVLIGEVRLDLTGAYLVTRNGMPEPAPTPAAPSTLVPSPPTLAPEYVASAHRVGWGSPRTGRIYSHGTSMLAYSTDLGTTWQDLRDFGTRITLVREISNGELIVGISSMGGQAAQPKPELWRSTGYNWGQGTTVTWARVLQGTDGGAYFDRRWGHWVHEQHVWIAEYGNKAADLDRKKVYHSSDNGATWRTLFTHPSNDLPNAHLHGIAYDKYADIFWVTTGDGGENRGIFWSANWRDTNPTWRPSSLGMPNQVGIYPMPSAVVFGSDDPPNGVSIYRRTGAQTWTPGFHPEVARAINDSTALTHVGAHMSRASDSAALYVAFHASVTPSPAGVLLASMDGIAWHELWRDPLGTLPISSAGLWGVWQIGDWLVGELTDDRQTAPATPYTILRAKAPRWVSPGGSSVWVDGSTVRARLDDGTVVTVPTTP